MDKLQVTEQAIRKIKALLEAEGKAGYGLRLGVRGGGCSGFTYTMDWEEKPAEDDQVFDYGGLAVFVDSVSLTFLDAVEIDYVEGLQDSGFKFRPERHR